MFKLNIEKNIAEVAAKYERLREREVSTMENTILAYLLLNGANYNVKPDKYGNLTTSFNVEDMKEFHNIHEALGKTAEDYVEPASDDARTRMVRVHVRPVDPQFRHLSFSYEKRLPRSAKCKLVRQTSFYTRLECDNTKAE